MKPADVGAGAILFESQVPQAGAVPNRRNTVVYATDKNFWAQVYVAIYSLLDNNRDLPLDVVVLSEESDHEFARNASALAKVHGDFRLSWRQVTPGVFDGVPLLTRLPRATYFRLLIDRLLPPSVEDTLYLDGDTIVRRSLRGLLELPMGDWTIAAAGGFTQDDPERLRAANRRLELPPDTPFFNSGVMRINLRRWRELQVERQCVAFIDANRDNPSKLTWADNDVLDSVFAGHWLRLSYSYNFANWTTSAHLREDVAAGRLSADDLKGGPALVHFAGRRKPWTGARLHPFWTDYWHYRQRTPYAARRGEHLGTRLLWQVTRLKQRVPGLNP